MKSEEDRVLSKLLKVWSKVDFEAKDFKTIENQFVVVKNYIKENPNSSNLSNLIHTLSRMMELVEHYKK